MFGVVEILMLGLYSTKSSILSFLFFIIYDRLRFLYRMNFFGLLNFQAPYLPWVLFAFSLLLGNSVVFDLIGIIVGHAYYFLEDIFPHQRGGFRVLKTPQFLYVYSLKIIILH